MESNRVVCCGDLHAQAVASGEGYRRLDPALAPEAPVLLGQCRSEVLRPGLSLHCTEVRDLHDLTIQAMQGESLHLALVLDGQVDVSFGSRRLGLDSSGQRGAQAAFVVLREPELFVRRARRGNRERKVSISFSRKWLEEAGADGLADEGGRSLFEQHLAIERWTPSTRAVALAEQLLHPPPQAPVLHRLCLESRVIELAAEALHHLLAIKPLPSIRPRERRRIASVLELLDSGEADGMSLAEIGRQVGSNVSTLQKQFRAAHGLTVFDYLRRGRLLRARHALEREGRSIVEAAGIAGYTSPANFATAYKRQFGLTPRQSRSGF